MLRSQGLSIPNGKMPTRLQVIVEFGRVKEFTGWGGVHNSEIGEVGSEVYG